MQVFILFNTPARVEHLKPGDTFIYDTEAYIVTDADTSTIARGKEILCVKLIDGKTRYFKNEEIQKAQGKVTLENLCP